MKFSCVTTAAPGEGIEQKCQAIASTGCTGIETIIFQTMSLARWQAEFVAACANAGLQPVAVIIGGLALYRHEQLPWVREAMAAVAEVGAALLLTAEYQPQDPLPLFPPYPPPLPEQREKVEQALDLIVGDAKALRLPLLLEPVTQFESRFWRSVDDLLLVCRHFDDPLVGICLDFHNMNITEAGIPYTIRKAGHFVHHIHLADNNRRLPGRGHIDFVQGLKALHQQAYDGWYSFECAVDGDFAISMQNAILTLQRI